MENKIKNIRDWTCRTIKEDVPAIVLFVLLVLDVVAGVVLGVTTKNDNLVLVVVTFALVLVTGIYGWHTRQLAKSTAKQAEITLNSMLNGYAPVIKVSVEEIGDGGIQVNYKNVGLGPALNLWCWIQHEEMPDLSSDNNKKNSAAVGPGEDGSFIWQSGLKLPSLDTGFNIIAKYNDIYGRNFDSRLEIINRKDQQLNYGLSKEHFSNEGHKEEKLVNEKKIPQTDASNKNKDDNAKSWKRELIKTYSFVFVIAILILFASLIYSFWKIGSYYKNFNNPIEVLQGIIIASTALLGLCGTFLATKKINRKDSGKWGSFLVYFLYAAAVVVGFVCVTGAISTLIDWPSSSTIPPLNVVNGMRSDIRYFFTELFLFGAAFFVSIIAENIFASKND
jgi:uncharacterized membrane protein